MDKNLCTCMESENPPPLPPFNYHGYLPEGVHDTTMEQLCARVVFNAGRRILWIRLKQFHQWAVSTGGFSYAYIDGGFITAKAQPEDIDVILQTRAPYGAGGVRGDGTVFCQGDGNDLH